MSALFGAMGNVFDTINKIDLPHHDPQHMAHLIHTMHANQHAEKCRREQERTRAEQEARSTNPKDGWVFYRPPENPKAS